MNSVLEDGDIEVDKQAELPAARASNRKHLGVVNRLKVGHRLDFNNNPPGDEKVNPVATVKPRSFVVDGERTLPLEGYRANGQLPAKTLLVSRLEQAGAKGSMNLDRCSDDLLRTLVQFHLICSLCALCVSVVNFIFRY